VKIRIVPDGALTSDRRSIGHRSQGRPDARPLPDVMYERATVEAVWFRAEAVIVLASDPAGLASKGRPAPAVGLRSSGVLFPPRPRTPGRRRSRPTGYAVTNIPGLEHRIALARATSDLVSSYESGLPTGRIIAQVTAASNEVVRGLNLLGDDIPPPDEYVWAVMRLAREDLALIGEGTDPPASEPTAPAA
jgi:hypothetical protein